MLRSLVGSEMCIRDRYPELAAKLAELMPLHPGDVRAVAASRRITIENSEIDTVIDIVRQHIGVE